MKKILKSQARLQMPQKEVPIEGLFELYRKTFSAEYFDQLSRELGVKMGKMIFNWMVVIFGMILQRLNNKGNLHAAVADLIPILPKFSDHKRVREMTVSTNPGGFSRARSKIQMTVVEQSFDHLFESLHNEGDDISKGSTAFLLDGSTVTLEATPELLEAYPAPRNQHGVSHWPILRLVVAHDLRTGLACRPVWGPMVGPNAVSEQRLAEQLMARLPAGSLIVADRNFGIFSTAYQAVQTGHPVVVRLTQERARALAGQELKCGTDCRVVWKPSRSDLKKHADLPACAQINGRLLVHWTKRNDTATKLILFTTSEDPGDEIFSLYDGRWNIETDLRSLKQTVRMHALTSRTTDMVAKELILGVAGYNLVHAFMQAAAQKVGLKPRQLSFSQAQDCVYAALPALMNADSPQETNDRLQHLLRQLVACKLPKRKKRRSYPRKLWLRRRSYPTYPTDGKSPQ